jgi:hypothetical protein
MSMHRDLIERLYVIFSKYRPGNVFNCTFCYSFDQLTYYQSTPVRNLPAEEARIALWETGDHWDSSQAYRYFLPRMLEVMGPPVSVEDLYPTHILETLAYQDFRHWPNEEKDVVMLYLRALEATIAFSDSAEKNEWEIAMRKLVNDA